MNTTRDEAVDTLRRLARMRREGAFVAWVEAGCSLGRRHKLAIGLDGDTVVCAECEPGLTRREEARPETN